MAGKERGYRPRRQQRYAAKHRRPGQEVHLVGVTFSREGRNIVGFEAERG